MADEANVIVTCSSCAGTGKIMTSALDGEGKPLPGKVQIDCPSCNGEGTVVEERVDVTTLVSALDAIEDKVDAVKDVCDLIWDKVNV